MDNLNRPDWDDWYMGLCLAVAQRSLDPVTKHGCVIVGTGNELLSVGYNSPPRGCNDSDIPQTRPEKYLYYEHSESNAILNAARTGIALNGAIFYVTGLPCHECMRKIVNVGASRIVYGEIGAHCISAEGIAVIKKILPKHISLEKISLAPAEQVLTSAVQYSITKKKESAGLICNSIL